jgi:hypothetical protein
VVITFSKMGEIAREGISSLILHAAGLGFLPVRSEFLATTGKASGIPAGCADTSRIIALVDKNLANQASVSGTRYFSLWGTVGTICRVDRTPSPSGPRKAPPPSRISGHSPVAPAPPPPSGPAPAGPPPLAPSPPSVHTTQAPMAASSPEAVQANDSMDVEGGVTEAAEDLGGSATAATEAASRAVQGLATGSRRGAKRVGSSPSAHQQGKEGPLA